MFQKIDHLFTPLRTTAGDPIPFDISLVGVSRDAKELGLGQNLTKKKRQELDAAASDPDLLEFWPRIQVDNAIGGASAYVPDPNQPLVIAQDPYHHPFAADAPYWSLSALADSESDNPSLSRRLRLRFDLKLARTSLVGGIAYMGYPSLLSTIDASGLTSSNYGLPREMRITIASDAGDETSEDRFIDSDTVYSKQLMNSSSGFHFFHVEPTRTNRLSLELSDFPLLTRSITAEDGRWNQTQAFGFAIPYLYVYEYEERSRYHHYVPGGVVGVIPEKKGRNKELLPESWVRRIGTRTGIYQIYPASSIFRNRRAYLHLSLDPGFNLSAENYSALEQFVSPILEKGESISLVCQQCDQALRSIAGIRLLVAATGADESGEAEDNLGLPKDELELIDRVAIEIYELDFPAGASVLDARKSKLNRYKRLLARKELERDSTLGFWDAVGGDSDRESTPDGRSIRFSRSSNQRYFEIVLTNTGDSSGRAAVLSAQFLQSANVVVHPKLAYQLHVSRMHFRLVGGNLLDDYSKLGSEGFNFSVEHLSEGRAVQQILAIRSMADLIQSGMARVLSNSRRRATEFEKSTVYDQTYTHPNQKQEARRNLFPDETNPNFHVSETLDRGAYWHKATSGKRTHPDSHQVSQADFEKAHVLSGFLSHSDSELASGYKAMLMDDEDPQTDGLFESYATSQSGVHSEYMFPDSNTWDAVKSYFDSVEQFASFLPGGKIVPASPPALLSRISNLKYWNGLTPADLVVYGVNNYFLHPGNMTGTLGVGPPAANVDYDAIISLASDAVNGNISLHEFVERILMLLFQNSSGPSNPSPALGLNTIMFFGGTGGSISGNLGAGVGVAGALSGSGGIGASLGIQSPFPGVQYTNSMGTQGVVTQQSNRTAYSYAKTLNDQARASMNFSASVAGENKRIIERREVPGTDKKRLKGSEIVWQDRARDIVLGTVPINLTFPALADSSAMAPEDLLRVRLGNGVGNEIDVDFWFETSETEYNDDF